MALNYILLSGAVVIVLVAIFAVRPRMLEWRRLLIVLAVVVMLTALFDPILVRLGLIDYDYSRTLGLDWFGAPIEDFAYAVVAALFVPYLWERFKR